MKPHLSTERRHGMSAAQAIGTVVACALIVMTLFAFLPDA